MVFVTLKKEYYAFKVNNGNTEEKILSQVFNHSFVTNFIPMMIKIADRTIL